MVGRSSGKVSLTLGNWIGLLLLAAVLVVPFWSWTTDVSREVSAAKTLSAEAKSQSAETNKKIDLLLQALVPGLKQEPPDAKAQANALR